MKRTLNYRRSFYVVTFMMLLASCAQQTKNPGIETMVTEKEESWQDVVAERLPEMGHRNWIVVADAAYPKQSSPGIETIYTGGQQLEVLLHVLKAVDASAHVRPIVMFDSELASVSEQSAPGVEAYRTELNALLAHTPKSVMPHEDIIAKLDKGAELFNILLLKTDMTIPYTSVFIELDCGYWSAEKERELRDNIAKSVEQE